MFDTNEIWAKTKIVIILKYLNFLRIYAIKTK